MGSEKIVKLIIWKASSDGSNAGKEHSSVRALISDTAPGAAVHDGQDSLNTSELNRWTLCSTLQKQEALNDPSGQMTGATCPCLAAFRFVYVENQFASEFALSEVAVFGMTG